MLFVVIWAFTLFAWCCAIVFVGCVGLWELNRKVRVRASIVSILMIVALYFILARFWYSF